MTNRPKFVKCFVDFFLFLYFLVQIFFYFFDSGFWNGLGQKPKKWALMFWFGLGEGGVEAWGLVGESVMMAEKMGGSAKKEDVEALLDLSLRRFFYSSLAGAFAGLLIFSISLSLSLSFFSHFNNITPPPIIHFNGPTQITAIILIRISIYCICILYLHCWTEVLGCC